MIRLLEKIKTFLKRATENYTLFEIENGTEYKDFKLEVYRALVKQTLDIIEDKGFWDEIKNRIGKAENIWTESDELQIVEVVNGKFKSIANYLGNKITEFYYYLANKGGQSFLDKEGINLVFELKDVSFLEELNERQNLLIDSVDNTTKDWLSRQIVNGKKNALTDREIANKIKEQIPETYKYRAETIANTEMGEIVNRTEMETAIRSGSTKKTWRVAGMNVCPICQMNDGVTVGINGEFPSGNQRPPQHPNCKCLLEYDQPQNNIWTGE